MSTFVCNNVGTVTGIFFKEQVDINYAAVSFSHPVRPSPDLWHRSPNLPLGCTPLSCLHPRLHSCCVLVKESSPQMLVIVWYENCGLTSSCPSTRPCVCAACLPFLFSETRLVQKSVNVCACACLCRSSTSLFWCAKRPIAGPRVAAI